MHGRQDDPADHSRPDVPASVDSAWGTGGNPQRTLVEQAIGHGDDGVAVQLVATSEVVVVPDEDLDEQTLLPSAKREVDEEGKGNGDVQCTPGLIRCDLVGWQRPPWLVGLVFSNRLRMALVGEIKIEEVDKVEEED